MQLTLFTQELPYGKTSPEPCQATKEPTSVSSFQPWLTSGRLHKNTQSWTRLTSECPSDGEEYFSSLSSILRPATDALTRYYLSSTAAEGILRRSERRDKTIPEPLKKALIHLTGKDIECLPSATTPTTIPLQH